jgi:hypothetical protein
MLLFNNNLGRLGNQLFTYATLTAICKRKGIHSYYFSRLGRLTCFDLTPREHFVHKWKMDTVLKALFRLLLLPRVRYMDHTRTYSDQELHFLGTKYITAALQGEGYFKDIESEIRRRFHIQPPYAARADEIYNSFTPSLKNVCVHVRRGDYLSYKGNDYSVPLSYYQKALSSFDQTIHRFVFISDDIDYVKEHFEHFPHTYFSMENEITDLQLMIKADHCVIANSTFSWWGAWLNPKLDKQVFVPKYFMGIQEKIEFPKGIIPLSWTQIEVE